MTQQFESPEGYFATADGPERPHDINKVIRANLGYLKRQKMQDAVEKKWIEEFGEDWIKKFEKDTGFKEIVEDDFKLSKLQTIVAKELGVDEWFFETGNRQLPEISRRSISEGTGISEGRLAGIDQERAVYPGGNAEGGVHMTVEELIQLANYFDVTLAHLLTPPSDFIKSVSMMKLPLQGQSYQQPIPTSTWVLWLHNLLPLPEQDDVRFERNLSYPTLTVEALGRRKKLGKEEVRKTLTETRRSRSSLIRKLADFNPLKDEDKQNPVGAIKDEAMVNTRLNGNIIFQTRGLFVELRKGIRKSVRSEPNSAYVRLVTITAEKAANYYFGMVKFLRLQDKRKS